MSPLKRRLAALEGETVQTHEQHLAAMLSDNPEDAWRDLVSRRTPADRERIARQLETLR